MSSDGSVVGKWMSNVHKVQRKELRRRLAHYPPEEVQAIDSMVARAQHRMRDRVRAGIEPVNAVYITDCTVPRHIYAEVRASPVLWCEPHAVP